MDNASDNFGLGDINKGEKILKKPSIGGGPTRKRLMDISNLQNQQSNPANQDAKQQSAKVATEEYVDKLHKENTILLQLLADRNKLLELSRVEILKLRTNLEKVQQQNLQLAQANSHMLREVNSGKDRLLVIQHELACKSGFLKAMKLEAEEKVKSVTCQNAANEEVANKYGEAGESTQAAKVNKPGIANRRQQSKAQSLDPPTVKAIHVEEMVGNKRHCSRRQSARFKSEELEANEDSFKMDDAKLAVSSMVNAKQTVENKKRCLRRQSARFKCEELEANEDSFKMDNAKLVVSPKETVDNKKQSARFKPEEPGVNEDSFKMDDADFTNSPRCNDSVHRVDNKKCSRRQCARFKSEETEANEDSFHMDDPKFVVSPRYDDSLHDVGPSLLGSAVIKEDGGETAPIPVTQEFRRSSVGRPSRRAAEKVTSYKEIPINVKMRRME